MIIVKRKKIIFNFVLIFLFIALGLISGNSYINNYNYEDSENVRDDSDNFTLQNPKKIKNLESFVQQITNESFSKIKSHIYNLSNMGSRFTGYLGYKNAIDYIKEFFINNNLESIQKISYPVLVPIDEETKIKINTENYTAYTILPNSVHASKTSAEGITGKLIYGGFGTYKDLDGKKIYDSIVALEFNSQDNWINVASLGAKGVIFLEPEDTNRYESEDKSIDIPLQFPRVYVTNDTALTIRELSFNGNQSITIYSNMKWKLIEAENIAGIYPGKSKDLIIISSYFDSSSVVPKLSPGSDQASGISTLLGLIELMTNNQIIPEKSIMFLALSGHHQSAAGAREFVNQNYDKLNIEGGIKLFLSLDLSSTNNKIGLTPYGYLYKFKLQFTSGNNLYKRLKNIAQDFLLSYYPQIVKSFDLDLEVKSYVNLQKFEDISPITFVGDQEPFVASNVLGLSFFTAETHRLRFNTPFDLYKNLNFENLFPQVIYTITSIIELITDNDLNSYLDLSHKTFSLNNNAHVGFASIEGYVKEFNETTGWFSNVPRAIIKIRSFDENTNAYNYYSYFTVANDDGYYKINGISSSQPDNPLEIQVEAYLFNDDGLLVKAMNLGTNGQYFKNFRKLTSWIITVNPIVFETGTVSLFQVVHPYTQFPIADSLSFQVLDPNTRAPHFSYGYTGSGSVSLIFLPVNLPSIMIGEHSDGVITVFATNSSINFKKGFGYVVDYQGAYVNLGINSFITSNDLLSITETYIDLYTTYNIYDSLVDSSFSKASNLIEFTSELLTKYQYSLSISRSKIVQTTSYDAFVQSRKVITDATSSTIFFIILLIPFSIALVSLLTNFNSGIKRILAMCGVFILTLFFFYIIHPGLSLNSNIFMIIIGIIATIFVFPPLWMIYSEGFDYLKHLRVKLIGTHFTDTARTSTILVAMSTGISRMKKRKIRTFIALSSIILISFSLTLFTSASTQITIYSKGVERPINYEGIQIKTKDWTNALSDIVYQNLDVQYGNDSIITTRWWLYPFSSSANGYVNASNVDKTKNWVGWAILGLSPLEQNFNPVNNTLVSGKWFNQDDSDEVIISKSTSEILEVKVNESIIWAGIYFKIIGIVDGEKFDDIKDFDNEPITPKDNHATSPNVHIRSNLVLIMPSITAKNLGAELFSISLAAGNKDSNEIAELLTTSYGRYLEIRVGNDNIVSIFQSQVKSIGRGFVEIGLPIIIAILLMVNTSISTVYESRKEINIFTSLGLAPSHIAGLFLAEFLVYAVIGSVIGYLSGITVAVLASTLGLLPESLAINYSSGSVINSLGLGIMGILLATIYPLKISAKMSVPSVKRSWVLKTSPEGDDWTIPLPFVTSTEEEVKGILEFLREYFQIFESDNAGGAFFADEIKLFVNKEKNKLGLSATVNLAPFDMGIKQEFTIFAYLDVEKQRFNFQIDQVRIDGLLNAWESGVRNFVDVIRKQMLIWRNLPKLEKAEKSELFKKGLD